MYMYNTHCCRYRTGQMLCLTFWVQRELWSHGRTCLVSERSRNAC